MTHILIFIHWFVLVFTFGNVELVTIDNSKSNDFPIEELNGYTLREVFENDYNTVSRTQTNQGNYTTLTNYVNLNYSKNNHIFYTVIENIINDENVPMSMFLVQSETAQSNKTLGSGAFGYKVKYNIQDYQGFNLYASVVFTVPNITTYTYYNVDMTSLNILDLTNEQMNYWFNVYQENEQREINDTYDYIENELTTNDLIYIVLFALLWGLAIKIVKGVM